MPQTTAPAPTPALRAVIYDRVSRDSRGDARSVKRQSGENRAAVAENGWTLVGEYRDNDRSASRYATKRREDWPRLMEALDGRRLDVLVLWESSRGSRDVIVWFPLLEACRTHGVLIHITKDKRTYDPRISRDWKTLAEEGVSSADESNKTADRIKSDALASAQSGMPWGTCPYGYVRTYDTKTRALIAQLPDPDTAPVVIGIITRIAKGVALTRIRDDLNGRGIPSPRGKQWSTFTVRLIATNPVYIGKRTHLGAAYDATWPMITYDASLSEERNAELSAEFERDFYSVARILSDPSRKTSRPGRQKHLQSYLAECGKCEGPLSVRWSKYVTDWVYHCAARPGGCVSTRKAWFDEPIELLTIARVSMPDAYESFTGADDAIVAEAELEAARLQAEFDAWMDEATTEGVSPRAIKLYEDKHLPDIEDARKRAQMARVPLALRTLVEPGADVKARWADLTLAGQRDVLNTIFDRIALDPIKVRGTGRGGLDWTRVRVLPRGATEWVTLTSREDILNEG